MAKTQRTWPQFVLDATIPTLLGRFNHRTLSDFINRLVSIKRSTTPSTAHILQQIDQEAVSKLISNVLEKLRLTTDQPNKQLKDPTGKRPRHQQTKKISHRKHWPAPQTWNRHNTFEEHLFPWMRCLVWRDRTAPNIQFAWDSFISHHPSVLPCLLPILVCHMSIDETKMCH